MGEKDYRLILAKNIKLYQTTYGVAVEFIDSRGGEFVIEMDEEEFKDFGRQIAQMMQKFQDDQSGGDR